MAISRTYAFVLIALLLNAVGSWAAPAVVSATGSKYEASREYSALNNKFRSALNIPFYFNVPLLGFAPIEKSITENHTATQQNVPVVFNYRESRVSRPIENQVGLRLIAINGKLSRIENSHKLAESGLIKTGDILLSYRKEWYGTLRYSHIQLGVSHAGIAYVDVDPKDGKSYVYNIDMPLDEKTVGAQHVGRLDSEHYQGAPLLHVLRVKDLTDSQRSNIREWIRNIVKVKPYPTKLAFNKDYASPKFSAGEEPSFIGDLGRIALGLPSKDQTMYCSEFAWTLLSLRDCNPETEKDKFASESIPSCVKPIFSPLPVVGDYVTAADKSDPKLTIGMVDGPIMLADVIGAKKGRSDLIRRSVFKAAAGAPENISSGHRAVEQAILQGNPAFYDLLLKYYELTAVPGIAMSENPMNGAFEQLSAGFNLSQKPNYSPTSFQVHALLPYSSPIKAIEYVGTIAYMQPMKVKNVLGIEKTIDPYKTLLETATKIKN